LLSVLVPDAFAALLDAPVVELDRGALLIASELRDEPIDVSAQLTRLDEMADALPEPTLDGLTRRIFDELGFQGNAGDYYDPHNSYLDSVLDRRRGIPITLSVLCIEVGRRAGVPLAGVGMPGHFLLRDQVDRSLYVDPYRRGRRLDRDGCAELFRQIQGPTATFDPSMLEPVDSTQILTRMLANLRIIFTSRGDRFRLAQVLRLLVGLPGVGPALVSEASEVLTSIGRFDLAAEAADRLARSDAANAPDHHARADRLRARLN